MKKYLLLTILLIAVFAPLSAKAWCCRRITWGFDVPPIVVFQSNVFEVSTEQQCLDTCSGSWSFCQNFFRKDATVDTVNTACISATSGCCQVTVDWPLSTDHFAYSVNDQAECNTYCSLLSFCNSLYKQGQISDTSTGRCKIPPPPPSADSTTESDTPATVVGEVKFDYTGLTNPLKTVNVAEVIGRVIKAILAIIGSIFLMMVIYGGFTWMTAAGNDTKVAKGRSILMWAIIGIIVIFLAWMLVAVVFEALAV